MTIKEPVSLGAQFVRVAEVFTLVYAAPQLQIVRLVTAIGTGLAAPVVREDRKLFLSHAAFSAGLSALVREPLKWANFNRSKG